MRIVDDDRIVRRNGHDLTASAHTRAGPEGFCALRQAHAQRLHRRQRAERVVERKRAGDREVGFDMIRIAARGETHPVVFVMRAVRDQVVGQSLSEGGHLPRKALQQARRPRVVAVDDGGVAGCKELCLCVAVGLHRAVVVEVVLRQIREDADREADPRRALLHERVRGDLHHRMAAACFDHRGKKFLQGKRIGRRALGAEDLVTDHILIRADESDLCAFRLLQKLLEKIGRGGLAVRACHADHRELFGRLTAETGGEHRQGVMRIGY